MALTFYRLVGITSTSFYDCAGGQVTNTPLSLDTSNTGSWGVLFSASGLALRGQITCTLLSLDTQDILDIVDAILFIISACAYCTGIFLKLPSACFFRDVVQGKFFGLILCTPKLRYISQKNQPRKHTYSADVPKHVSIRKIE